MMFCRPRMGRKFFWSSLVTEKVLEGSTCFFPPHVGFQDAFDVICSEHVSEKSMAVRLEPRLQFEGGLIAATGADETWMNIRSPAGDERHGHRNPKEKWKHVSFR